MMVAGERSGDVYGAELATALRARLGAVEIFGCGGEAMRRAGVDTVVDAHQLGMVGLVEVLSGLPRAFRALRSLAAEADRRSPDLAILIDFPDFNLRLAKKLRRRNIPVVYFVSPQIWAWKQGRLKQLKATIDKMLCIFDFEEAIYKAAGIPVEYVGHPLLDLPNREETLTREQFFAQARLEPEVATVALLPGSRQKEVSYNLPTMLDGAARLAVHRKVQFVVAVAPTLDAEWLASRFHEYFVGKVTVRRVTHLTGSALQHSDVAIVASGTATLEAALRERPMIVVYRVSPLSWKYGKLLVRVPFYSMVNLLAGKSVVPELMQDDFTAPKLAAHAAYLLDQLEAREEMVKEFKVLKARLGSGGAIPRAAEAVIGLLWPASKTFQQT